MVEPAATGWAKATDTVRLPSCASADIATFPSAANATPERPETATASLNAKSTFLPSNDELRAETSTGAVVSDMQRT